jgi:hypothetical protein
MFVKDNEVKGLGTLAEVYLTAKYLVFLGEELDPEHQTQLGPLNEFRNAFDHLMRVIASKTGLKSVQDVDEYARVNLDKAFGHVYRAGYDAVDLLAIIARERIERELSLFCAETINTVLPTYYSHIKPRIFQLETAIPDLRGLKDIGEPNVENFQKYLDVVSELTGYLGQIISAKPGLVAYEQGVNKAKCHDVWRRFAVGLAIALVSGLIGYLIKSAV